MQTFAQQFHPDAPWFNLFEMSVYFGFVFVSTDINCAPFLNSENKEMNHYFPIKHPYWQLYMSLLAVDSLDRSDAKQLLRRLAAEVDFSPVDRLYLEMQMSSPWFIPTKCHYLFFERMREKYCYSVMHPDTIDLLKQLSPIVELGAGNGYNAWLLAQAGVDVVALEAYPLTWTPNLRPKL